MFEDLNLVNELICVLRRHRRKVIAFSSVVFGVVALIILFGPRTYESESRLYLRLGRESVGLDPTATVGETVMIQSSRRAEIQSAIDILVSRGIHAKVVDRIGERVLLGYDPLTTSEGPASQRDHSQGFQIDLIGSTIGPLLDLVKGLDPVSDREEAILLINDCLKVKSEIESNVIQIRYTAESPHLAKKVVDTLMDEFLAAHVQLNRISGSHQFFDEQVERLELEVRQSSKVLSDLKNEYQLTSIEDRRKTLEAQYHATQQELTAKRSALADANAQASQLRRRVSSEPERLISADTSTPNTGTDLLRNEYFKLKLQQMEITEKLTRRHPQRRLIEQQVREAEKALATNDHVRKETTEDVNPVHQQLRLELLRQEGMVAGLQANLAGLRSELEQIVAKQESLNEQETQLHDCQLAYDQATENLKGYKTRLEQTRLDQALQQQQVSNANIVHEATLNSDPVSPKKALLGIAGILLALAGSVAIAFTCDQFDTTIKSSREVRTRLGIPVLASIPQLEPLELTSIVNVQPYGYSQSLPKVETVDSAEVPSEGR